MAVVRKWFYLLSGLIAAVVPILLTFGVLTPERGDTFMTALAAIGSLIGAGGAVTAGVIVNKQQKDHVIGDPAEVIRHNIPLVVEQYEKAQRDIELVRQTGMGAVQHIPVLGPLAEQVLGNLPGLPGLPRL